jgi:hypothetical protein
MKERLAKEVLMRERLARRQSRHAFCQLSLLREYLVLHRPKITNLTVLNSNNLSSKAGHDPAQGSKQSVTLLPNEKPSVLRKLGQWELQN